MESASPKSPGGLNSRFRAGEIAASALGAIVPIAIYPGPDAFERPKLIAGTVGLLTLVALRAVTLRRNAPWLSAALWICFLGALFPALQSGTLAREWWGSEAGADGVFALGLGAFFATFKIANSATFLNNGLVAGTFFACLYAILQRVGLDPIPWSGSGLSALQYRPFGTLGNPSFLAFQICLMLPFVLEELIKGSPAKRRFVLVAGVVLLSALGLTMSRIGIITACGVLVVHTIVAVRAKVESKAILGCAAILIASCVFSGWNAPISAVGRFEKLSQVAEGSLGVRQELWKAGLESAKSPSLLGKAALLIPVYLQTAPGNLTPQQRANPSFHNLILDAVHQRGLLGLFGLLLFILSAIAEVQKLPRGAARRLFALVLFVALAHTAVGFFTVGPWLTFCLLLGSVLDSSHGGDMTVKESVVR